MCSIATFFEGREDRPKSRLYSCACHQVSKAMHVSSIVKFWRKLSSLSFSIIPNHRSQIRSTFQLETSRQSHWPYLWFGVNDLGGLDKFWVSGLGGRCRHINNAHREATVRLKGWVNPAYGCGSARFTQPFDKITSLIKYICTRTDKNIKRFLNLHIVS